ncbi:MAG: hypothetical protein CBB87_02350 [Micavibrio sp. TMED27]|nr:hypothetical protein [Micavibrio sp.]OUT92603.1 MAG: hypothetical protein CBB87_02350 [Micavibrio sp. TMED27]|tara:strand:+ start:166 stop:855 length:690 start_codon:yes stop_codon:yes gene_type:complete
MKLSKSVQGTALGAALLAASQTADATPITFDLEDFITDPNVSSVQLGNDFQLSTAVDDYFIFFKDNSNIYAGETTALAGNLNSISLSRTDGAAFAFNSFAADAFANIDTLPSLNPQPFDLTVNAQTADGQTVQQLFAIDNLKGLELLNLNDSFNNVTNVSWNFSSDITNQVHTSRFTIDDAIPANNGGGNGNGGSVNVSEPGTLGTFAVGGALLAAGAIRRRKQQGLSM